MAQTDWEGWEGHSSVGYTEKEWVLERDMATATALGEDKERQDQEDTDFASWVPEELRLGEAPYRGRLRRQHRDDCC